MFQDSAAELLESQEEKINSFVAEVTVEDDVENFAINLFIKPTLEMVSQIF